MKNRISRPLAILLAITATTFSVHAGSLSDTLRARGQLLQEIETYAEIANKPVTPGTYTRAGRYEILARKVAELEKIDPGATDEAIQAMARHGVHVRGAVSLKALAVILVAAGGVAVAAKAHSEEVTPSLSSQTGGALTQKANQILGPSTSSLGVSASSQKGAQ